MRNIKDGRVKVLNIRPILELGLLEANCQIHKCFDEYYDKDDQPITVIKDETTGLVNEKAMQALDTVKNRFMGTLRVNFVARYGIDMRKMKVKIDDDLRIVEVQRVEPKYLGCKGFPKTQWMYSIPLKKNWLGDWTSNSEAKAIEGMSKDRCRALTEKSLQSGPEELEWLKQPLLKTVHSFLLATVVPSGYSLKLVDRLEGEHVSLLNSLSGERQAKPALTDGIDREKVMKRQIREMLIQVARQNNTISYSEVGEAVELDMANPGERSKLANTLDQINREEHKLGRPLLSAVVVQKESGHPGTGFFE